MRWVCVCFVQIVEEHTSVELSRRAQAEPISLDSCLKAFTSEEELGEDELYYCSKCKTHCLATKKLDLWRLPPILVFKKKKKNLLLPPSLLHLFYSSPGHWGTWLPIFIFQIVHLKRFQFVNGRWIKSQKIVKFPRQSFNPSAFLAPRDAQGPWSLQSQSECPVEELQKLDNGDSSVSSISTTTVVSLPVSSRGLSLHCLLCLCQRLQAV